jgi:hypothetical protein
MNCVYRCGRLPPVVKTAVPVDGRFERIVLSCNAMSDHAIIWIEREAQRALDVSAQKCISQFYCEFLTPKNERSKLLLITNVEYTNIA